MTRSHAPAGDEPPADVSVAADPGGAHIKGFSADPAGAPAVPADGPLPMVTGPGVPGGIHQPEREGQVRPTGRSPETHDGDERLLSAER